ncbi:heavy-metal-associated domain-containing protein [Flavivirga eckloniae]|uniref:Heavy metal transporter n=1 Tax=Flavivirga eckloniae TaxID=1803846 RepID=A0A2K9PS33_9FLAO|nr:heavy metal-associated domain-containing protein [Flavivirga eckloniae]AUP79839.1 heavy metal transporter [Flavivirga eckloniae]
MNALRNIIAIVMVVLITISCKNEKKPEVKTVEVATETTSKELDPNATYAKAEFTIDGMTCAVGCAKTIEKKISKMEGVKSATVDFDRKLAMVEYNEAKVTPVLLEETVTKVADVYKVSDMKTVDGFSTKKACAADCAKACCANKTEAEKKACAADCTKACCAKKA